MNKNFSDNLKRVIQDLPEYAAEIMKDKEKEVIALEKEQLLSGLRADGERTQKYVSEPYIRRNQKRSAKSFPNRNYYVNGSFHKELALEHPGGEKLYFVNYSDINKYIEPQEDNKLYGLTDESNLVASKIIVKPLLERVGNELSK